MSSYEEIKAMHDFISEKAIDDGAREALSRLTIPRKGGTKEYHALQRQEYERTLISLGITPYTYSSAHSYRRKIFGVCLTAVILLASLLMYYSTKVFDGDGSNAPGALWVVGICVFLVVLGWTITAGATLWNANRYTE